MIQFNIAMFRDFQFLKPPVRPAYTPHAPQAKSESDQLLDLVYSVAGKHAFPTGDIACYLSENTSEEVRAFIERKLFLVNSPVGSSSDLDDDVLIEMMRKRGESLDSYKERLSTFIEQSQPNSD